HLVGDEGWTAVRTAVHGGRVLSALAELTAEETAQLWSPLETTIALPSLDVDDAATRQATNRSTRRVLAAPPAKTAAAYGPNHAEVAAFIRGVAELSPIQWLRVLDRRKLVASVTREGAVEPAGVGRSILIAPEANVEAVAPLVNAGTALIDFFGGRTDDEAVATWHAVSALVRRHQLTPIKFAASYAPFASAIPVTNPRSLGAMVSRYVTAVGR